jgi:transposase
MLSESERNALDSGFRTGKKHGFRQRCRLVLLKGEGLSSDEVGKMMGCHAASVNTWLKRYKTQGIKGLHTHRGRGRKPILKKEEDAANVLDAIKANRQRLSLARAAFEASSGKKVSDSAFRAFLKALADDTNE